MSVSDKAVEAASAATLAWKIYDLPEDAEIRAALEAAAPFMAQPVIHDVDWALDVLQKCGIQTGDQFDALVTLQKLTP